MPILEAKAPVFVSISYFKSLTAMMYAWDNVSMAKKATANVGTYLDLSDIDSTQIKMKA